MDVKLQCALIGLLVKVLATSGFRASISLIVDRVPAIDGHGFISKPNCARASAKGYRGNTVLAVHIRGAVLVISKTKHFS